MRKDYANLEDGLIEILHNPNITNNCYLIRLMNYSNERYEMRLSGDDLKGLADFIYRYLEKTNEY
jgi:hypothetical protein